MEDTPQGTPPPPSTDQPSSGLAPDAAAEPARPDDWSETTAPPPSPDTPVVQPVPSGSEPTVPPPPATAIETPATSETGVVTTSVSQIGVPAASPVPETQEGGQEVATQAIAPGDAGAHVQALAAKVEAAGEKTYLSDPNAQNPAHVFTDDLMAAVRRVLHAHPAIVDVTDEAERQRLNRWISGLQVVTGEVHKLLDEVAASKSGGSSTSA